MAVKKSRAARLRDEQRVLYEQVFMLHPFMVNRIECILDGAGDPFPETSGSSFLEAALAALAQGKPVPAETQMLIAPVQDAVEQLFILRDRGPNVVA